MKLTKKLESEITSVYHTYWKALLMADIDTYTSVLDEKFKLIGTTESEVFFKSIEAIQFLEATADQVAGNIELRNRIIKIELIEALILVTEQSDTYVKIDGDWSFYGKARISSLVGKKKQEWKFIQMHLSFPDSKADEGQTIGLDKITKENLELRDAIKRRNIELENKNRELEIEASLEKVRTVALSMRKPDDMLEVCRVISNQLKQLGVKEIRNVQTAIIYEAKGFYMNYEYYAKHDKSLITEVNFSNHPLQYEFAFQMLKGPEEFYEKSLKGLAVKEWYDYQKTTNQFADSYLETAPSLNYYWYSMGNVALGMSTYTALNAEEIVLFKRFRNVFDLAYQRYADIKQAEAQAREAKIEASLERVRSKTLAMHNSEDVGETVATLFDEFEKLGVNTNRCGILINSNEIMQAEVWTAKSNHSGKANLIIGQLDLTMHPLLEGIYHAWKQKEPVFNYTMLGDDLKSYYQAINNTKFYPTEFDQDAIPSKEFHTDFYFNEGSIFAFTAEPINEKAASIFKRFANLFGQTYTRFLDLQKAEAQAREAKIEAALEKARSRSMGMQSSDELPEVANVLFLEVQALGIPAWSCGYNIITEDKTVATCWMSSEGTLQLPFKLRLFGEASFAEMGDFIHSEQTMLVQELGDKALEEHYAYMKSFSDLKPTFNQLDELGLSLPTYQINHLCKFTQGFLLFITYEKVPYAHEIFKRFTRVFEQTYTRFLDLQKAEEQAREAQIELGLERVRARTMAMQESNQLADAAQLLYQEFGNLGINTVSCGYMFVDEAKQTQTGWAVLPDGSLLPNFIVFPLTGDQVLNSRYKDWKEKKELHTYEIQGEANKEYHRFLSQYVSVYVVEEIFAKLPDRIFFHCANFSDGYLFILATEFFQQEDQQTMIRFAKVFQQTYTRFLDLQKAEAQAREARIETALEKVRSRTMAMQKGEELKEVAVLLYKELIVLGVNNFVTCGYVEINEKINRQFTWVTSPGGDTFGLFYLPLTGDTTFDERYAAWKQQQIIFHQTVAGEVRSKHLEYAITTFNSKEAEEMVLSQFPDPTVFYCFNFSHGYLHLVSGSELKKEEELLLVRFTRVFEQTYARFLDLQKAEAQARESQIQLALERVRARTMAMQTSEDLKDAAALLFQQVKALGAPAYSCGYNIWEQGEKECDSWMSTHDGSGINPALKIPLTEDANFIHFVESKKNDDSFYVLEMRGERMQEHYQYLIKTIPVFKAYFEESVKAGFPMPEAQIHHLANFSYGNLMFITLEPCPEFHDVFKRFAAVFEQTYTRFLDLKKAEEQAREAKIELALERVRARTMAMQRSDELVDVATVLFQQVKALGVPQWNCGFNIWNIGDNEFTYYPGSPDGIISPSPCKISLTEHPVFKRFDESRKQGDELLIYEKEGEEQADHYRYMLSLPGVGDLLKSMMDSGFELPKFQIDHLANFAYGNLIFITYEHFPEMHDVFKRFAKVFEQTYTRFLDLQKAEAQARESKIEAALERVRSRTLAMQKSEELAETAAVLFQQLIKLGIAPNRLYIGIIKDDSGNIEAWATDEAGGKINNRFTLNRKKNASVQKMFNGWKAQKKSITIEMKGKELADYLQYLSGEIGVSVTVGLSQHRRVQNVAYFGKGFIGIASPDHQPEETIQLIERFTAVFNLTYTRFNDLKIAEAHGLQAEEDLIKLQIEKKRAEDALSELKATQTQLIQSEKMASLGELTAGIAHEIQNPLNFVNNFSEVSAEMIEEMKEEMAKGDLEEAISISNDLKQNLEKISFHGNRASSIVKGMLEHSRTSSGQKELVDINALADEYLKLTYHGLRAKDKFFNADFETNFDKNLPKIKVIPQDMGRVLLNLINNAFYAVKSVEKPLIQITTQLVNNQVIIKVSDNGAGIPEEIKAKIFQPFFTTKPTGQGTGLGLSLAYDMVNKGHGGELKVESKENEGTTFSILLPIE